MRGAIFGDIVGSVYEFNNVKTKDFTLFTEGSYFTDDSVMTLALADALMKTDIRENPKGFQEVYIKTMHKYGERYPDAGYGGKFAYWLLYEKTEPYNSFGNGSAMRVSPVAWYAETLDEALLFAKLSAEVTHNHPEGIKGAVCTAGAAFLARNGADKDTIRAFIEQYYDIDFTLDEIRESYTFNETCQDTVPQAMVAFLESESFEDAIRLAISIGGDSDTLGAITGAVAECFYGMTDAECDAICRYLDDDLNDLIDEFSANYMS